MQKLTVAFFTGAFPYYPGEQFIESEIEHWSNLPWANVVICPYTATGTPRNVPNDVEVFVADSGSTKLRKLWYVARAACSPLLWRELRYLGLARKLSLSTSFAALRSVATTMLAKAKAAKALRHMGHIDIAYCYWNAEPAYAACLLKRQGTISAVVSRAHGFDLYQTRRRNHYMPLKRQFVNDFDVVYPISDQGKNHLLEAYGFCEEHLSVSRLGVRPTQKQSAPSSDGVVRVVSVSFCVAVKRIDRIIEAIQAAEETQRGRWLHWTHIGDGPLRTQLEALAAEKLNPLTNVEWQFAGTLPNGQVLAFYATHPVDAFINCSESEGVPVSIMEAMVRGVPAIAPRVGGIPELVDDTCGALLPRDFLAADVVAGLIRLLTDTDREKYREAARRRVAKHYNAPANYSAFVDNIRRVGERAKALRDANAVDGRA